jgi:hypothetical protein
MKNSLKQHTSKLYIGPILPIPSVVDYVIVSPVVVSYQPQFLITEMFLLCLSWFAKLEKN